MTLAPRARATVVDATNGSCLVLTRRSVEWPVDALCCWCVERPWAYKDVAPVIDTVARTGVARRVARLMPLLTIKG